MAQQVGTVLVITHMGDHLADLVEAGGITQHVKICIVLFQ
jgi:hypothetical protein